MKKIISTDTTIATLEDLKQFIGSDGTTSTEGLAKSFLRDTNYDVGMEVVISDATEQVEETWQVEIIRGTQRNRVRMRPGGRGAWRTRPDQIPKELLAFIQADPRSRDQILTTRSWATWERGRWMRPGFRRHRSKSGIISFSMNASGIERRTGEKLYSVLLSVFGADEARPIALTMPFRARDLNAAIDEVRMMSASYFMDLAA